MHQLVHRIVFVSLLLGGIVVTADPALAGGYAPPADWFTPQPMPAPLAQEFIPTVPVLPRVDMFPNPELVPPAPIADMPVYVTPAVTFYPQPDIAPSATYVPAVQIAEPAQTFIPNSPAAPTAEIYVDP